MRSFRQIYWCGTLFGCFMHMPPKKYRYMMMDFAGLFWIEDEWASLAIFFYYYCRVSLSQSSPYGGYASGTDARRYTILFRLRLRLLPSAGCFILMHSRLFACFQRRGLIYESPRSVSSRLSRFTKAHRFLPGAALISSDDAPIKSARGADGLHIPPWLRKLPRCRSATLAAPAASCIS